MKRDDLLKMFAQRQLDAHLKIDGYTKQMLTQPFTAALNIEVFVDIVAQHTVASDMIALLQAVQPGEDPKAALKTELKSMLQAKVALGHETSMAALMMRWAMIESIIDTLKHLET